VATSSGGETFFKVEGASARQKLKNFCSLNWQMLRHTHWNTTSLTFVSMCKQFNAMLYKTSRPI